MFLLKDTTQWRYADAVSQIFVLMVIYARVRWACAVTEYIEREEIDRMYWPNPIEYVRYFLQRRISAWLTD